MVLGRYWGCTEIAVRRVLEVYLLVSVARGSLIARFFSGVRGVAAVGGLPHDIIEYHSAFFVRRCSLASVIYRQ